jgi:hypothetical protein
LVNVTSNAAFTIPMNTSAFGGNLFPLDMSLIEHLKHHEVHPSGGVAVSHVGSGGTSIIASHSAVSHLVSHPRFADSITLDGGVTLQLYHAFDASNRFVGPRLRYRRIGTGGFTDTDVMLQPAQNAPK